MSAPRVGERTGNMLFQGAIVSVDGPSRIQKNYWYVTIRTASGRLEKLSIPGHR